MPAPRSLRPTVMDWWLQVFFFGHNGRTGAVSCWGNGSGHCARYCYGSSSASGSVAPSTAAPDGAVCLEVDNELHVHRRELCREPHGSTRELYDGGAVTRRGFRQV